jgi:hypothetical protein
MMNGGNEDKESGRTTGSRRRGDSRAWPEARLRVDSGTGVGPRWTLLN